jgi:hypothetical protein
MARPFPLHVGVRDLLEFIVNQRDQLLQRLRVSVAPRL